jgi:hypothetical protein
MAGFLDLARTNVGEEFASAAAHVLEALDLPDPQAGEFVDGTESRLVFLNDCGLVVRAGEKMKTPEHARILAPLRATRPFQDAAGAEHVIEILPGAQAGITDPFDRFELSQALKEDGINFWDAGWANCGYIPVASRAFPDGLPVVLDRGALKMYSAAPRERLKGAFGLAAAGDVPDQKNIYASFHMAFGSAWPEGAPLPAGKLTGLLAACRADLASPSGVLCNIWLRDEIRDGPGCFYKTRDAMAAAETYQARLRREGRLFLRLP